MILLPSSSKLVVFLVVCLPYGTWSLGLITVPPFQPVFAYFVEATKLMMDKIQRGLTFLFTWKYRGHGFIRLEIVIVCLIPPIVCMYEFLIFKMTEINNKCILIPTITFAHDGLSYTELIKTSFSKTLSYIPPFPYLFVKLPGDSFQLTLLCDCWGRWGRWELQWGKTDFAVE